MLKRVSIMIWVVLLFLTGCNNSSTTVPLTTANDTTTMEATSGTDTDFQYVVIPGGIRILGLVEGRNETVLVIPEWIDSLPVIEIADYAFFQNDVVTEVSLPSSLESIGERAFYENTNLVSVDISGPSSLREVREMAFGWCTKLEEVQLEEKSMDLAFSFFAPSGSHSLPLSEEEDPITFGNLVFYKCANLVEFTIPDGVRTIPEGMFTDCESIESIVMPDSVVTIADLAFSGCRGLVQIEFSDQLKSIGEMAFSGCIALENLVFPDSLEVIGGKAFEQCISLGEIHIPPGVRTIGPYAFIPVFTETNSLRVYVEASVRPETWDENWIPNYVAVFWDCASIETIGGFEVQRQESGYVILGYPDPSATEILIPNEMQEIPVIGIHTNAFAFRPLLSKVVLPASLLWIEDMAFYYAPDLVEVVFETGSRLSVIGKNVFTGDTALSILQLPDSVVSIGMETFAKCSALRGTFVLPPLLTVVESGLFSEASGLREIILPAGVERIEDMAFRNVFDLRSLHIPSSIQYLGEAPFSECYNLILLMDVPQPMVGWDPDWNPENIPVHYNAQNFRENGIYLYEIEDGHIRLVDFLMEEVPSEIILPDQIDGVPVTILGSRLFLSETALTKVTFSDNIRTIEENAFSSCSALREVVFGENSSLEVIENHAFSHASHLLSVTLPTGVVAIGDYAFFGAVELTDFTIPRNSSLQSIGTYAFGTTPKLEEIFLPASVSAVGYWAFSGMLLEDNGFAASLDIYVQGMHPLPDWDAEWVEFTSKPNAVIWDCDEAEVFENFLYRELPGGYLEIVRYLSSDSETTARIPEMIDGRVVIALGAHAFAGSRTLTAVELPHSIQRIERGAFLHCPQMIQMRIPSSVSFVGSQAFDFFSTSGVPVLFEHPSNISSQFDYDWSSGTMVPFWNRAQQNLGVIVPRIVTVVTLADSDSLDMEITEIDPDGIAVFVRMELYDGLDLIAVDTSLESPGFEGLFADQDYLVKIIYSVQYPDSAPEEYAVYRLAHTVKLRVPEVESVAWETSSEDMTVSIDLSDPDLTITEVFIRLYDGNDLVEIHQGPNAVFLGLFSNHDYRVSWEISYDPQKKDAVDGLLTGEQSVHTLARVIPLFTDGPVLSTTSSVTFAFHYEDPQQAIRIDSVQLYLEGELVEEQLPGETNLFGGLQSGKVYQIILHFSFDFNDRSPLYVGEVTFDVATLSALLSIDEIGLSGGNVIGLQQPVPFRFHVLNPDGVLIEWVTIGETVVGVNHDVETGWIEGEFPSLLEISDSPYLLQIGSLQYRNQTVLLHQPIAGHPECAFWVGAPLVIAEITNQNLTEYLGLDGNRDLFLRGEAGWTDGLTSVTLEYYDQFNSLVVEWRYSPEETVILDDSTVQVPWKGGDAVLTDYGGYRVRVVQAEYGIEGRIYRDSLLESPEPRFYLLLSDQVRTISTVAEFQAMESDYIYRLLDDLDFTGVSWDPILFQGILDGNDHVIRNLHLTVQDDTTQYYSLGLFRSFYGKAYDLSLQGVTISIDSSGSVRVGMFAGAAQRSILQNILVSGTISVVNDYGMDWNNVIIGGLVGRGFGTEIEECSVSGLITVDVLSGHIGGFCGTIVGPVFENNQFSGVIELVDGANRSLFVDYFLGDFLQSQISETNHNTGSIVNVVD